MNSKKLLAFCAILMVVSLLLAGCGKKKEAPEGTQSLSDLKAAAEKMSVQDLRDMAMKYKNLITAAMGDQEKLEASIKNLSAEDMLKKAPEIEAQINKIKSEISDLKERLQIYIDQLKAKGEAVTGLEL